MRIKNINQPLVSIIINCYNGEKFLSEALESVIGQTYDNWELILWDNQSSDKTADIFKAYKDTRLKYFLAQKHTNLGEARKLAVKKANGEWIAFLDSDDYWVRDKLEKQISAVMNTDFIVCYGGINEVDIKGKTIRKYLPSYKSGIMIQEQLNQFDINMVTPIILKRAMTENNIDFNGKISASEDYNIFIRLAAKGPVCVINDILGFYRVYDSSLTNQKISKWYVERLITLKELQLENPGIETKLPESFQEAYARARYYKARYYVSIGKKKQARRLMKTISFNRKYYYLYLALLFPFLWNIIHNAKIKRILQGSIKKNDSQN